MNVPESPPVIGSEIRQLPPPMQVSTVFGVQTSRPV